MNNYLGDFDNSKQYNNEAEEGYYRPKPQKFPTGKLVVLAIFFLTFSAVVWYFGYYSAVDGEAEYRKLSDKVCQASVKYVSDPIVRKNIAETAKPGEIFYIRLHELVDANLIGAVQTDYRTGQKIPLTTDIRMAVVAEDVILCKGFAWQEHDNLPPIINLIGKEIIYISRGVTFVDPGYYAVDYLDGDLTRKVVRSGHVNTDIPGNYHIYYDVSDRAGNPAAQVTRTIIVK